jgi:MFS transporter, MHS family, proline/betaine transporter
MAMEATISSTASARPGLHSVIVAVTIGNVLEWFDFLVYGFFAVTIAEVFFPADNPTVSLLITFGTFGLAYLMRPFGAIVVGTYTDRAGRKAGLTPFDRADADRYDADGGPGFATIGPWQRAWRRRSTTR